MRSALITLLLPLALGACGPDEPASTPTDGEPAASAAPEARPIRGMRAIDRARDASAIATERAQRHDTIR